MVGCQNQDKMLSPGGIRNNKGVPWAYQNRVKQKQGPSRSDLSPCF